MTDNGPTFTSERFAEFLKQNGIKHIKCAPYHPSSNGCAERGVRIFKDAMKSMKNDDRSLNQKLASFLMSYRSTPHTTTKVTPAELFLQRRIRTRLDIPRPNLATRIQRENAPKEGKTRMFEIGDNVLVRDYKSVDKKWIPGCIIKQLGPVTYRVKVKHAHGTFTWKRHVNQIAKSTQQISELTPDTSVNEIPETPVVFNGQTMERSETEPNVNIPPSVSQRSEMTDSVSDSTPDNFPTRRSSRVVRKPDRLIETM